MKKLALYFSVLLMTATFSCKQDRTENPQYTVVGTWQPYKIVETTVANGVSDSQVYNFSTCEKDSRWTFTADYKGSQLTKSDASGTCDIIKTENITYSLDTNNAISITHQNGDVDYGRVTSATDTKMNIVLETNTGNVYHSLTYSFNRK
jgi:hypothetical protein